MWIMVSGPYRSGTQTQQQRDENLHVLNAAAVALFRRGHTPVIGVNMALPMIQAGGGTIVNVSSGAAMRPLEGWSAYCTGKAGLAMLTRAIALENPDNGIRVFGFQPGTTDTDMQVTIRASGINRVSQIPRANLTPVAHPAAAIVYLCTEAAADLNGQEFSLGDEAFRARLNLEG